MKTYRAALVGCSRMGAFIDNEVPPSRALPYSHAASYEACTRTDLIAGVDLRPDVLTKFGERYKVSSEHLYTDFREMIVKEKPDIVSIATQPQHRAEIILFAAEHGVKALYPEKPLCASVDEADAIVQAVEKHKIAFNLGAQRRWHPGFVNMRDLVASGELGALKTMIIYANGTLFNTATHWLDTMQFINGDAPVEWVQGYLPKGDDVVQGDWVTAEPLGQGTVAFANGVMLHALLSTRPNDLEAICENGAITAYDNGSRFEIRRYQTEGRGKHTGTPEDLPYELSSGNLHLVEDLVHALDTGEPTRGGVRAAQTNTQIIFGMIESHRQGGARVKLPMVGNKLRFDPAGFQARQPKYDR